MRVSNICLMLSAPRLMKTIAFLILSLYLGTASAGSEQQAMEWVQKMSQAMQYQSYQGRFVYANNNQLESMSVLHINDQQGRRERLLSLNGEAREILRDDENLTCVWPSSRKVVVDKSSPLDISPLWIPEDVTRLGKFYAFELVGEDRIAGYPTMVVSILPRDNYRYGMKIWIDKQSALLLQSILMDDKGNPGEQIMFTDLHLLDESGKKAALSAVPKIDEGFALIRSNQLSADEIQADHNWQIESLPAGFWIDKAFRKRMEGSDKLTQHMILTDGMASVSVFIEETSAQSLSGASLMGAVNAFGARFNEFSITAIGEVPAITVQQIAESIAYNE